MGKRLIDDVFKGRLKAENTLPKNSSWNKSEAWQQYINEYGSQATFKRSIAVWGAVASIVLLVAVSLTLMHNKEKILIVSTDAGMTKQVNLKDGNVIWLNENSSVKYPWKLNQEEVIIDVSGEVFFDIKTNKNKTFIVKAGNTRSEIKNSSFNIKVNDDLIELAVTDGSMELAFNHHSANEKMIFSSGETGSVFSKKNLIFKEPYIDYNTLAWKTGNYSFEDVPLYYVVNQLNKTQSAKFTIVDNDLLNVKVRFEAPHRNLENILEQIRNQAPVDIYKEGSVYKFYKKKNRTTDFI